MGFQVLVTVKGLEEAITANQEFADQLLDFTEALTGLGKDLVAYYSTAPWVSDGFVFGKPWRPLKSTTLKEKTRHMTSMLTGSSPAQPLIRSGAMKAGFRFLAGTNRVFIDNEVPYWKFHQTGTGEQGNAEVPPEHPGRGKNLPQRMTAGINDPIKAMIQAAIGAAVKEKIEATYGS